MLDRPYPQDETIFYPQGRHALDSSWEKSKRKTERNLATNCRKGDAGVRNQLGRAEEESKRQATVAGSGHGLMCPRARRELSELSECIKGPVKISFENSF